MGRFIAKGVMAGFHRLLHSAVLSAKFVEEPKMLVMSQSLVKDLRRFVPLCTDCSEISHHNLWIMMRFHKYRA